MVAGLLMFRRGQLPRSDESSIVRMLHGQMVAFSWMGSSASSCCWVAMVATQGCTSASLHRLSDRAGAAPVWCMKATEGDLPTAPVNLELFYSKICLVSSSDCCQFGGSDSIAFKNGFEYRVAEISAHAGGAHLPVSHFSALHPVVTHGVLCRGTKDNIQVLILVVMLPNSKMNCRVQHLSDDITILLNMIFTCAYTNLAFYQISMKISEFTSGIIGYAARSTNFSWNHLNCVNLWRKVSMIVISLQHYYVHTHQSSINGSPIGSKEQDFLTCNCCTSLSLTDGTQVEDTVTLLFGLCHRRWTTTPSSLILRFNSGDYLSLRSVKAIQYLQLSTHKPQVHTPDRSLGESTTRHQLVWSTKEASKDCICSKFKPVLSTDKRPLFDSRCSLWYLLCISWSSRFCSVQLSTACSCSFLSYVILYCDR